MRVRKRRPIYYTVNMLHDGTVLAAFPIRKPSQKRSNLLRRPVDPDGVALEWAGAGEEISNVQDEQRTRFQDIIAVNLNTRRAIRDLALPRIAALESELRCLREQIERIERMVQAPPVSAASQGA